MPQPPDRDQRESVVRCRSPWCIISPQPNAKTLIVACFRRRSEAEAALRIFGRLHPETPYAIMFDPGQL